MRVNRWRNWHPLMQKSGDATEKGLTKLTEAPFVSFVSSQSAVTPNFLRKLAGLSEVALAENFHRWMLERCKFQMRSFGRIEVLHRDFCCWSDGHDEPLAPRQTFDRLLVYAGLFQANGLVSGLILCDDLRPIVRAGQPQREYLKQQESRRHSANRSSHSAGKRSKRNDG